MCTGTGPCYRYYALQYRYDIYRKTFRKATFDSVLDSTSVLLYHLRHSTVTVPILVPAYPAHCHCPQSLALMTWMSPSTGDFSAASLD